MSNFNRVILMGHLTRDPQSGTLPNIGNCFCDFGLAVNRNWKDAEGNRREEVLFVDCTAYGKTGETLAEYLRKGRPIHIEGRLKLDQWEQDGRQRSKIRVIVEQFRFVDSVKVNQGETQGQVDALPAPEQPKRPKGRGKRRELATAPAGPSPKDDIPF